MQDTCEPNGIGLDKATLDQSASISVVIPSYQRPQSLTKCLEAIDRQTWLPKEVIVVCRTTDADSIEAVRDWELMTRGYQKRLALVAEPGQVAALRMGTYAVTSEIVAYTDDDTIPEPNWLEKIVSYYKDPSVGGVGGRDVIHGLRSLRAASRVGVLTWYGKLIGNHHVGCAGVRKVDVLKGANASFRTCLVQFPKFLRGDGAQVHNEVYVCLRIRRMGYSLIYDPAIQVLHYPGPRYDRGGRGQVVKSAIRDAAFNADVTMLLYLSWPMKVVRSIYNLLLGHRGSPGLFRLLIGCIRGERDILLTFLPTQLGHLDGTIFYFQHHVFNRRTQTSTSWLRKTGERLKEL
ncbi:glycosyltransferase [Alicyclobacillus fastidiosus]|uniref:Glycosyltransferase n=1 Tax=Alicyclobacillus fastidiosus TaxID=392011 RepID=A0ABY6ZBH6_9BACL|nr:glycosyltransferase [Alicyclobacillus fastidiosus]WAH39888.1 glycosyltransferase [Alicyclobacillus fastidiosus]GMA61159.1 glycosyl transferase [Alicyclobacillus fastidiosus]